MTADPTGATGANQGGVLTEADLSRYDETAAQMRDPERYAALMALTFDQRHPCPIAGCRLSAEEHHRFAYSYLSENRALRQRVHDLEHGRVVDEDGEQR